MVAVAAVAVDVAATVVMVAVVVAAVVVVVGSAANDNADYTMTCGSGTFLRQTTQKQ